MAMTTLLDAQQVTRATYMHSELHGLGLADSSVTALLRSSHDFLAENGFSVVLSEDAQPQILNRALAEERSRAAGRSVASQDVAAAFLGGVSEIFTSPVEGVRAATVPRGRETLAGHLVFGYAPGGRRHHVPGLLDTLLRNPAAPEFVRQISCLARTASDGIQRGSLNELGDLLADYRRLLTEWNPQFVLSSVAAVAQALRNRLGPDLYTWKPPGGGGAEAIFVVVRDASVAVEVLKGLSWEAFAAPVTNGLAVRKDGDQIEVSVPHRLDLIGYADIGMNFGVAGLCVAAAVEPRGKLILELTEYRARLG